MGSHDYILSQNLSAVGYWFYTLPPSGGLGKALSSGLVREW